MTGHVAASPARPGRYAIADEAKLTPGRAVVVGLRYRNGAPLYDKTLQTVLGERPCRVIVVSDRSVHQGDGHVPRSPRIASMASPERVYHGSIRVFSFVFIALGVILLAVTLASGGGVLSLGTILGVLFVAIGAGRLWVSSRLSA